MRMLIHECLVDRIRAKPDSREMLFGYNKTGDLAVLLFHRPICFSSAICCVSQDPLPGKVTISVDGNQLKVVDWRAEEKLEIELEVFGREKIFQRNDLGDDRVLEGCIAVFGSGSSGSFVADRFARLGLQRFVFGDFDKFFVENIPRHTLDFSSLGSNKAVELHERILAINPEIQATVINEDIQEIPFSGRKELLADINVLVGLTDSVSAQFEIEATANILGLPCVIGGLHAGAASGEVFYSIPGYTKHSLADWVGFRRGVELPEGKKLPYSEIPVEEIGRVMGEPGKLIDIDITNAVINQIIFAILKGPESHRFQSLLSPEHNFLMINGPVCVSPVFSQPFECVRPVLQGSMEEE